jgi:GTP-dependent phosphoenolpyruvate carboxykinase
VCPLEEQRTILNPDLIFWIDDAPEEFQEFKEPEFYDGRYTVVNNETINDMIKRINTKR